MEIPSRQRWLSTWHMTLRSKGQVWYTDGSRMAGRSGAGVCGVRPRKTLSFSVGVHTTVFQTEFFFAILACAKECIGRVYISEHIWEYSSDSQAALQALESSRVTSALVWECRQELCASSRWNKVKLLWIPGYCGIQSNEDADALARKKSSSPVLGPEPAISVSPRIGRLKVQQWLKEMQPEHWAAARDMRQSKLFGQTAKGPDGLGQERVHAGNRVVNWSLCTVATLAYRGPPRKRQV
jgi:hypothetical protein